VTAGDELYGLVAPELRRQLRARARLHWQDLVDGAVDQALAAYTSSPDRYEPRHGDLMAWLATNSWHALINAARPFDRARRHEIRISDELWAVIGASPVTLDDEAEQRGWVQDRRRELLAVAQTDEERQFLEARLRGAPVAERAAILGGADLPPAEQRALVNRVWERLMVRLRRARAVKGPARNLY
jgi:hypothetical protein